MKSGKSASLTHNTCPENVCRSSEEKKLGYKIMKWRNAKKESNYSDEEMSIISREAKEAINILVEENLWVSQVYARKLAKKYPNNTLTIEDLEQEANIGLITAAKKFDPEKGCKFSSYAVYWVMKYIVDAIEDHGEIIRKPASIHNKMRKIHKYVDLSPEDAAEKTGIKKEEIVFIRDLAKIKVCSLEEKINGSEETDQCYEDIIPDDNDVFESVSDSNFTEQFKTLISQIEDKTSRQIILWYLGFTPSNSSYTCQQISRFTGITSYKIKKTVEDTFRNFKIQLLP